MMGGMHGLRLLTNREIYEEVILRAVPEATSTLWIGTADVKDLHVAEGKRMVPFLKTLSALIAQGVNVRLLHAKEPGPNFRRDFDAFPNLIEGLELMLCPRVHFKCVVVDGRWAYSGSANLTGAGMGAKSEHRRNFEMGFVTEDPEFVEAIAEMFDAVWIGSHCAACGRKEVCPTYPDMVG